MANQAQPLKHPDQSQPRRAVQRPWYMELVLGAVALAVVYLASSLALDSGSLIAYVVALLFAVLALRHFYRTGRLLQKGKGRGAQDR